MFESLKVENFKCFDSVQLNDLKPINVLVGENSSGKSALLESIYMMCGSSHELWLRTRAFRGVLDSGRLEVPSDMFYKLWTDVFSRFDTTKTVNVTGIDSKKHHRTLSISMGPPRKPLLNVPVSEESVVENLPMHFQWNLNGEEISVIVELGSEPKIKGRLGSHNAVFLSPTNPNPPDDAKRFSDLSKAKKSDQVVDEFKKEFPQVHDLSVELDIQHNMIYADLPSLPEKIPLRLHSAGAARFLSILLAVARYPSGVVLIDELENGLYYKRLPHVWKCLLAWAKRFEVQLFVSTHSKECLESVLPMVQENEDEFCFLRTEIKDGISGVKRFSGKDLGNAIEQDFEVR